MERGDLRAAEEAFQEAEILARKVGEAHALLDILAGLATLYLDRDNAALAATRISQLREAVQQLRSWEGEVALLGLEGRLAARNGNRKAALEALDRALALSREKGALLAQGKAHLDYCRALGDLGEEHMAEGYRVQAREIFTRLGAKGWLRKMEKSNAS
jgi:tetratricopeptide (TPR) repeat protein